MAREEQKMRSDRVRQMILETALEIGLQEGFEAVSVRKIINKMNYSTGIVYHHFKDKQEIIDAIEEEETAWLHSQITQLLDSRRDVISNMEAVFHRITMLAVAEPEKYNLIVLHKYSRQKTGIPHWIRNLGIELGRAMDTGLIRKMEPEQAAFSIWSSFLGFHIMLARQEGMTMEQAEEMFRVQFDIIRKGVLAHESF